MDARLPEHVEQLWRGYEESEGTHRRTVTLERLRAFVDGFGTVSTSERREWVRSFCRRALSDVSQSQIHPTIVIRQPLFDGVLLPELADLFRSGDPEASLWLAELARNGVTRDWDAAARVLGLPSFSPLAILQSAVNANPSHFGLRRELMGVLAGFFDYALHELPAGVLYGIDGATPEQCDELLAEVEEFRRLAPPTEPVRDEEVAWWEFHFRAYRDYLRDHRGADDYANYLERSAGPPPRPRYETGRTYPYE